MIYGYILLKKKIIDILKINPLQRIIVSDCRFPHEIKMLKSIGAMIISIQRNVPEWFNRFKIGEECEETSKLHLSEISWIREEFDYEITNNFSSVDEFELFVDNFLDKKYNIKYKNYSNFIDIK